MVGFHPDGARGGREEREKKKGGRREVGYGERGGGGGWVEREVNTSIVETRQ